MTSQSFESQTVLVTGGAAGIGRLMAERALDRGAHVVLWDISEEALDEAVSALSRRGQSHQRVKGVWCDVSKREAVYRAAETTTSEVGPVDVLINNAGIVSGDRFFDLDDSAIERTIGVNTMSLFWTAKAFVPSMIARNSGHVVTIASAAGVVGVPKLADYCASKHAAVGFDESLRLELRQSAPNVKTTVVCPYYINTGMFDGVQTRFPSLLPILEPEQVADRVITAIEKGETRVIMPPIVRLIPLLRMLPTRVLDGVTELLGVHDSMHEFRGRA